MTVWNC